MTLNMFSCRSQLEASAIMALFSTKVLLPKTAEIPHSMNKSPMISGTDPYPPGLQISAFSDMNTKVKFNIAITFLFYPFKKTKRAAMHICAGTFYKCILTF